MTQERKEPREWGPERKQNNSKGEKNRIDDIQKERPSMDPCLSKSSLLARSGSPPSQVSWESPGGEKLQQPHNNLALKSQLEFQGAGHWRPPTS